ncbi:MAG: hypothetical protein FVQ85_14905 [Planctomycetes bacterium]|nr:hypothetical protein [Planctomycetota bacterium]
MKQSKTMISVIVAAVGLLAAFAIGLYVREIKQRSRSGEPNAVVERQAKQTEITPRPSHQSRQTSRSLTPEQRTQLIEQIEDVKQRWATMSEAEKKEFRAKMVEISQAGRPERSRRFETSTPEGSETPEEEFLQIKNRWEDMSEKERQEFMDKMRESSNAIKQGND